MNKKNRITFGIISLIILVSIAFISYIIAAEDGNIINKADGAENYTCSKELTELIGENNIDKVLVKAIVEEGVAYNKFVCSNCGTTFDSDIDLCTSCGFEVFASEEGKSNINNDKELTLAEIESIRFLKIDGYKDIKDLSLLKYAKNLEVLSLEDCGINDKALITLLDEDMNCILDNCTNLRSVSFKHNKINNLVSDEFSNYQTVVTLKEATEDIPEEVPEEAIADASEEVIDEEQIDVPEEVQAEVDNLIENEIVEEEVQTEEPKESVETKVSLLELLTSSSVIDFDFSSQYIENDNSPIITFKDDALREKLASHYIMGKYDIVEDQLKYSDDNVVDQNGDGKISILELNQLDEILLPAQGISSLECSVNDKEYGLLELVPELLSVDLRDNNLTNTGKMDGLIVEDYINFANNKITSIENFQNIARAEKIVLNNNKIESLITKREVASENSEFKTFETVGIVNWNCYKYLRELDINENYVDIYSIETDETGNLVKTITLGKIEEAIANHGEEELVIDYKPQKVLASNDFAIEGLDKNLEKLLKKALKGDENSEAFVGKKEMLRLTSLNVNDYKDLQIDKIESLAGMEYAANLQKLDLSNQKIADISPIANLVNLKEVNLEGNLIDDLSKLLVNNELKLKLDKVNFNKNFLARVADADNSINENVLNLMKNNETNIYQNIEFIGPVIDLNNAVSFEDANLKKCIAENLGKDENAQLTREDLLKVTELNLSNKNIMNLAGLEFLGNLTKINLSNNSLNNINSLVKCSSLKDINLSNCSLGANNIDVNVLFDLPNLQNLNLSNNDLDISKITWSKEANICKAYSLLWSGKQDNDNSINLTSNKLSTSWEEFLNNLLENNSKFGVGLTVYLYNVKDVNNVSIIDIINNSNILRSVNSFAGNLNYEDSVYSIIVRNSSNDSVGLDTINCKVNLYGTVAGTVKELKYARILNSKDIVATNKERVEYFEKLNKNVWSIPFDTATFEVRDNGLYLIYAVIEENGNTHKITKYISVDCLKEIDPLSASSKLDVYDSEFIVGIEPNTSKDTVLNEFNNDEYLIEINDNVFKTGTAVLVKNKETGEELKEFNVMIFGDVNEDGLIDSKDVAFVKGYLNKANDLNQVQKVAADVNRDGIITENDLDFIINHCLQKENELIIQSQYVSD